MGQRLTIPSTASPFPDLPDAGAFKNYARGFYTGNPAVDDLLKLKEEHTYKVLENAARIGREEAAFAAPGLNRALLLGALYHDVARFPQFARYRTFVDAVSCNHGLLGARVIRQQGFLDGEEEAVRRLAVTAVACHNRFRVPPALREAYHTVLLGVRDADKLDIMRVMKDNLGPGSEGDATVLMGLSHAPGRYSPAVLSALEEGRVAAFKDMRVFNDFRLLLCTWLEDLHFRTSYAILSDAGYLWEVIEGLEGLPDIRERVRKRVEASIARRLGL